MRYCTLPEEPSPQEQLVWQRAALGTGQADPFCCTPAWQLAFQAAFCPQNRIFVAQGPDAFVVFSESCLSAQHTCLTPIDTQWFFACPLLGRGAVGLFMELLDFFAQKYAPHFPRLVISGIRPESDLGPQLLQALEAKFHFFLYSTELQGVASLQGGVDGYLSRRSANHRSKLKKALRRGRDMGLYFERCLPTTVEQAQSTYARMLAVEKCSWKGLGQCGMTESPAREFYDHLIRRLAPAQDARIIFARQEDKDIGFVFGGMGGTVYRGQQFSFHTDWKNASIGNLLQVAQIQWLCEEGATRYDMGPLLGPRMEYKQHWIEEELEMQTWLLVPKDTLIKSLTL